MPISAPLDDARPPRTRRMVLALVVCGLGSVLLATSQAGVVGMPSVGMVALAILAQVVLGALLTSRPVIALLLAHAAMVSVVLLLGNPFMMQVLTYLPLTYNLGRRRNARTTWPTVLAVISTTLALHLLVPHPNWSQEANSFEVILSALLSGLFIVALPAVIGQGTRWQAERLSIVVRLAEAERQDSRAATASALQAERARMARELHDVAAHHMTAVMINAKAARKRATGADPEVLAFLNEIAGEATRATRSLQQVVGILRDEEADADQAPTPSLADLPELVARAARINSKVRLLLDGDPQHVPAAVGLAAYRIVQESLTNAHRHAPGAAVQVEVAIGEESLHVVVDSERPAAPDAFTSGSGRGVAGMRSRATGLGGTLRAGPEPHGWRVEAQLPYDTRTTSGETRT